MSLLKYLSNSAKVATASVIAEITERVTDKSGIIAFHIGMPARESLLIEEIATVIQEMLQKRGVEALQYSPPQGIIMSDIQRILERDGIKVDESDIMITTGALQGAFLVAKAFINRDDFVLTEAPTYSINLQTFRIHGANIIGVPLDSRGIKIDILKDTLSKLERHGNKPKFVYVIPDFHNPTGIDWDIERRKELLDIADVYDLLIVEDAPYRYLRYKGERKPSLYEINPERVIHLGSFSKIFSTGIRVGYLLAQSKIIEKLKLIKQSIDFNTPTLNQLIVKGLIEKGLFEKQVEKIRKIHMRKLNLMINALKEYMQLEAIQHTSPKGGIFIWLTLPKDINVVKLLNRALEEGVTFVPGYAFYPGDYKENALRLNFTYPWDEEIEEGIIRLMRAIKKVR